MSRSSTSYLSYTALVLLCEVSTTTANLWTVDIDEGPAPSPEDGPPFSAHASRNLALLPYQIIGIVGAYIGSVLVIGTLLLTVGRKLRKQAQDMTPKPTEMVKPLTRTFDKGPASPHSSWLSPKKLRQKKSATTSIHSVGSNQMSPGVDSVASFDTNVLEADRAKRQDEMERLYAAVMAQDEQRQQHAGHLQAASGSPPEYSRRNPPRLMTDGSTLRPYDSFPISPVTPKSPVRAIYPPDGPVPSGAVPSASPGRVALSRTPSTTNYTAQQPEPKTALERASSVGSNRTFASTSTSGPNKLRKSLRSLKISAPIIRDDGDDDARTPLSPRFYTDPGVPPEPPHARTTSAHTTPRYPNTPASGKSWQYPEEYDPDEERIDEIRELPQPNPQRTSAYIYDNQPQAITNIASTRQDPTTTIKSPSPKTLPLREMNRQYAAQRQLSPQEAFPLSPGSWNANPAAGYAASAGPVRTTFVEARRDKLNGPRTGSATPYSPYMPFTPLTPVTPHLTSRAERKQREREERAARGVVTEEEAVVGEGEMWSSGY